MRGSHFLLLIFMCAIALPLGWRFWTDYRTQSEERRIMVAEKILVRKLEVYQIANGRYPDSIEALSFTNSTIEKQVLPDIQQLSYQRNGSGYILKYDSLFGFHSLVQGGSQ